MNPYSLLKFLLAQESTFKRGPLSEVPDPEERIDCQRALNSKEVQEAVANVVALELQKGITGVGYPRHSEIVQRVARLQKMHWFFINDQGLEGTVQVTDRVCLVIPEVDTEDNFPALEACLRGNLCVVQVIVILDREQGGFETLIQTAGPNVRVSALVTRTDLRNNWLFYMT